MARPITVNRCARLSLKIKPEYLKKFREICNHKGVTQADLVEKFIDKEYEKLNKK